jgi:hypothetical protein
VSYKVEGKTLSLWKREIKCHFARRLRPQHLLLLGLYLIYPRFMLKTAQPLSLKPAEFFAAMPMQLK